MKTLFSSICCAFLVTTICVIFAGEHPNQREEFISASSKLIKSLSLNLKKELSAALQQKGVPTTIQTCKTLAPTLTNDVNNNTPLYIRRTSLKWRNPANTPDEWEQKVLSKFEEQFLLGTPIEKLTFTEVIQEGDSETYRHMRAIPIQAICLTCHGNEKILSSEVKSMLKKEYPNDLAVGFSVGEIRGAFSVSQTIQY